jgi:hypothetical protein
MAKQDGYRRQGDHHNEGNEHPDHRSLLHPVHQGEIDPHGEKELTVAINACGPSVRITDHVRQPECPRGGECHKNRGEQHACP